MRTSLLLLLAACRQGTPQPAASLVSVTDEPAGANCPTGGVALSTGVDADHDGVLDPDEITETRYVCDGATSQLVRVDDLDPGAACAAGGIEVHTGYDLDGDGALDDTEIVDSVAVCAGEDGASGDTTLVRVDDEPAGTNCPSGGLAVYVGTDADGDGTLDEDEEDAVAYVCDGADAVPQLVRVDDEPAGTPCPRGGVAIHMGLDVDGDATLDTDEITATRYVCDGAPGDDARATLVDTAAAPVSACAGGGFAVRVGVDDDDDGVLDTDEIDTTRYVCNGADAALLRVDDEAPGGACTWGGLAVHTGLDDSDDGVLDPDEVDATEYLCAPAPAGLLRVAPAGAGCATGGDALLTGLDLDGDGYLDGDEVTATTFVCDGADGVRALAELHDPGSQCPHGGTAVWTGLDLDGSGDLEGDEVADVSYVCHGAAGLTALVRLDPEPPGQACRYGGTAVSSGVDHDGNTVLDTTEIQFTEHVCDAFGTGPLPQVWTARGTTDATRTGTGFSLLPEMSLDITLDVDSVVLVQFDWAYNPGGTFVEAGVQLVVDGVADGRATTSLISGATGKLDTQHAFRILELGAGQHTVRVEWTGSANSRPATDPLQSRILSVLAVPETLNPVWGYVAPTTDTCHSGSAATYVQVPGMALSLTLPTPSVVLSQFDLNLTAQASGDWVAARLEIDDVPESTWTVIQPIGAAERNDLHLSRLDRLGAGTYQFTTDWGHGSGTMCANGSGTARRMGVLAIPVSTGVQFGYAAPTGTVTHAAEADWTTMPGVSAGVALDRPTWYATVSFADFTFYPATDGSWAGLRLAVDGVGLGAVADKQSDNSEDTHTHVHDARYLIGGTHRFEGQWGKGAGSVIMGESPAFWTRRVGALALPVTP